MSGEKGEPFKTILESANDVMSNIVKIIMYYAPIGLGCYMASFIGSFGSSIAVGYLKTFFVYLIVSIVFYFVIYTIYAYVAGGKRGIIAFWKRSSCQQVMFTTPAFRFQMRNWIMRHCLT